MRRKRHRRQIELTAAAHRLAVAAIFGIEQQFLGAIIVIAIGPAEIRSRIGAVHHFGRAIVIVFRGVMLRIERVDRIAIVHHRIDRAMRPGDIGLLPQPGDDLGAVILGLVQLGGVEFPDAAMLFQDRAGILAGRALHPVAQLAGIGRAADIDIKKALVVEGQALVAMLARRVEAGDHGLGPAGRHQLARGHLVADHLGRLGHIEIAVMESDAGAAAAAEFLLHVEAAIAGGVVHRDHAARIATQRHIEIAIRRHRGMAGAADIVCRQKRAKAVGQGNAAIAGIAGGRGGRCSGRHGGERQRQGRQPEFRHLRPPLDLRLTASSAAAGQVTAKHVPKPARYLHETDAAAKMALSMTGDQMRASR